jgi:hypothetical protein
VCDLNCIACASIYLRDRHYPLLSGAWWEEGMGVGVLVGYTTDVESYLCKLTRKQDINERHRSLKRVHFIRPVNEDAPVGADDIAVLCRTASSGRGSSACSTMLQLGRGGVLCCPHGQSMGLHQPLAAPTLQTRGYRVHLCLGENIYLAYLHYATHCLATVTELSNCRGH